MLGVLSLLTMPLTLPEGIVLPFPEWVARILNLVQPAILLTVGVWAGISLGPKVGVGAPALEAAVGGEPVASPLGAQLVPGLIGGVAGGSLLLASAVINPLAGMAPEGAVGPPLAIRVLYGGITEEIMVRWGFMTFILWAGWRISGGGPSRPGRGLAWAAIIISAVVFGALHLPIVFASVIDVTAEIILFIIIANAIFGIIAGYLFWRYGLESAIIAHMLAHLVAYAAEMAGVV